ncbi:hypothetical protein IQ250_30455 [Pseudanabaenaceae cyanobacterium LEGE 13415]|nr:hypothetical protein [Pseudanabaenaceae cyanobacterium LEGE 13415]
MVNDLNYIQIGQIARAFGIFDCIPCARAIKAFLVERGIAGTHIKLDTGSQDPIFGRIYDDSIGELIATTGHPEGIEVLVDGQKLVFDNVHTQGIDRSDWIQNLYSPLLETGETFRITEIEF